MNEPLVSIGLDEATETFRDLVNTERSYLGSYNLDEAEVLETESAPPTTTQSGTTLRRSG